MSLIHIKDDDAGLEILQSPESMNMDDEDRSFANYDEMLNKEDKINLMRLNYK